MGVLVKVSKPCIMQKTKHFLVNQLVNTPLLLQQFDLYTSEGPKPRIRESHEDRAQYFILRSVNNKEFSSCTIMLGCLDLFFIQICNFISNQAPVCEVLIYSKSDRN